MTPSRLSAVVIAERIGWVESMLAGVRALPLESLDAFGGDPRTQAAAESYLRRALEALLDLGRHVLAKGFAQPAVEYRDIPRHLATRGIITDADVVAWLKMAGYRNRMVHVYAEVSQAELYEICVDRLGDIEAALAAMRRWIAAHPELLDSAL